MLISESMHAHHGHDATKSRRYRYQDRVMPILSRAHLLAQKKDQRSSGAQPQPKAEQGGAPVDQEPDRHDQHGDQRASEGGLEPGSQLSVARRRTQTAAASNATAMISPIHISGLARWAKTLPKLMKRSS